jgi:asparaginyl-tRNA synthetase
MFKRNLEEYFWNKDFVQFEPPTLTLQTLYSDEGALWLDVDGRKVSLSRCATFHLEPALLAYEKVFAITTSFANEKSRSNRHLTEFTHLKAELAWVNLQELITLAGDMYYSVAKKTVNDCKREIIILGLQDEINKRIEKINPINQVVITYDEAIEILHKNKMAIEYGKSISASDEKIITKEFEEKFVWIKYIPCSVEGFPFKKKVDAPHLSMTCDLIAPEGYGEILGTAEKITDVSELLDRMREKGKDSPEQLFRYQDYINLRKYGLPEHGGIGMGIERGARYILNLPHVRFTRPFPVLHGTKLTF